MSNENLARRTIEELAFEGLLEPYPSAQTEQIVTSALKGAYDLGYKTGYKHGQDDADSHHNNNF